MPKGNLNALVGKKPSWASKTESRVSQADTKFANLLIDSLVLNPDNQNYNSRDEADKIPFEELVASIKLIGIRQPLDVEEIDSNKYMIISGERRYKAAKEAKLKVVPCVIKSSESKLTQTIAKNVTNLMVRELSNEQRYRGYCEIRDAIEAEGKSIDDPEYASLFQLTDKKAKKLFKKFDMIRRLTSDEDYQLFLDGAKTYASIEESALDMEEAMKITRRINELYALSVQANKDISMTVYMDDEGFVYYVSLNEKLQKYVVMERDYSRNVEGHMCRSSFLPPCDEKEMMQAYLDRYAVANHLKKMAEKDFEALADEAKGNLPKVEEVVLTESKDESETVNKEYELSSEQQESKDESKEVHEEGVPYSKMEHSKSPKIKPVTVEEKRSNITLIPTKKPSESATWDQNDIIKDKEGIDTTPSVLFEFEGEEINSGKLIKGTLVKYHDRTFLVRGNISLKNRSFINRGITCYSANCVVMEVKPETLRMKSG